MLTYVLGKLNGKIKEKVTSIMEAGKRIIKNAACKIYLSLGYPLFPSLRSFYILKVYQQANKDYVPEIYPGRLIIFKAAGDPP